MKVAALDFGSNTFLCLIAEDDVKGGLSVIEDHSIVVRLGQGLAKTGKINEEAFKRAKSCLENFKEIIKKHSPDAVLAVATAATRTAANGSELVKISNQMGIPIKIISGNEEAELTFKGTLSNLEESEKPVLIVDIGGASTEVIFGSKKNGIIYKKSFEIGVVMLKEGFINTFPLSKEIHKQIKGKIGNVFSELRSLKSLIQLNTSKWEMRAVAGTPTSLAAAALGRFDVREIEGFEFSYQDLEDWEKVLISLTPEQVEIKFGTPSGRSDVLNLGVMILLEIMKKLQVPKLRVSTLGLRYGLALELLYKNKELI